MGVHDEDLRVRAVLFDAKGQWGLYLRAGKKEKDGKTIKEECALWKQRADKKGRMAAVSGVGRRGSHACVYCSFFSRYSFIASFTMSFSDMFFLMARNFIRV